MLGLVFASLAALPGVAQQNANQPPKAQSGQAQGKDKNKAAQQDSAGTYKINVNLVNLYFLAKDKRGAMIPNLSQDQFQVLENGQPQTIKYFQADATQPLTMGLLVDTSGSEGRMLGVEQEVADD